MCSNGVRGWSVQSQARSVSEVVRCVTMADSVSSSGTPTPVTVI